MPWAPTVPGLRLPGGGADRRAPRRGAAAQGGAPRRGADHGGTDVMVELNFDRRRPEALLDLNGVRRARRLVARERHVRLGASLTYTEAMEPGLAARCRRSPRPRARSARRRSATAARSAATSAPPRRPATRCRRCSSRAREVELASVGAARARCRSTEFLVGAEAERARADELIVAVRVARRRRAADVHEGRPAERDGDRGLLARAAVDASATSCARRSARPGRCRRS